MNIKYIEESFNIAGVIEKYVNEISNTFNWENIYINVKPTYNTKFGHYQIDNIISLAKKLNINTLELAQKLLFKLKNSNIWIFSNDILDINIEGIGFINFKLKKKFILYWLLIFNDNFIFNKNCNLLFKNKKIIIDYSSPNIAKRMHIGHIRSMVIGDSIYRILKKCGANIIRNNHLGDWGTQFGILIQEIKRQNYVINENNKNILFDFENLYQNGYKLFNSNEEYKQSCYKELFKLQNEDVVNIKLWNDITKISYKEFNEIYEKMNIKFDLVLGESFYRNKLDRVYKELYETGLFEYSHGALIKVYHDKEGSYPFIIRKSDGSSNYAAIDLAKVLYSVEELGVNKIIYVTDKRQENHFKYMFITIKEWFNLKKYKIPELNHISFGTILDKNKKPFKTRSGDLIPLKDLLNESINKAYEVINIKNTKMTEFEKQKISNKIGINSIKYSDLVQNIKSDYIFDWNKTINFEGNTAPYILYAIARIYSIFEKESIDINYNFDKNIIIDLNTEKYEDELINFLIMFPYILNKAAFNMDPPILTKYLYNLTSAFGTFYNKEKILKCDFKNKIKKLFICQITFKTLKRGLNLLGVEILKKM